jgi:hypothetical protein
MTDIYRPSANAELRVVAKTARRIDRIEVQRLKPDHLFWRRNALEAGGCDIAASIKVGQICDDPTIIKLS